MLRAPGVVRAVSRGIHRQTVSFMEYADAHKAAGAATSREGQKYECGPELYSADLWTYYKVEDSMANQRLPQPKAGIPDLPRDTNPPAPKPQKK